MKWPTLIEGTLISRYKRFMADVKLRSGTVVTAHCPNSGSMKSCCEPGRTVYLSRSDRPGRRLAYTWEMIEMPSSLVGVNTMVPNRLVREAILLGLLPQLGPFEAIRSEVPYGAGSRIDLLLERGEGRCCYIEVKNCTLIEDGVALFPDAVTSRGLKHVEELQAMVRTGHDAVAFFLIQRMDSRVFRPADRIDPAYGSALRKAAENGVQIMAYDVVADLQTINLRHAVPCEL